MSNDYGRKRHGENPERERLITYILYKLRNEPDKNKRGILFDSIMFCRDENKEEIKKEVFSRWKK